MPSVNLGSKLHQPSAMAPECCVCLCERDDMLLTHCNHDICRECLVRWARSTCPLCRADIGDCREAALRASRRTNEPHVSFATIVWRFCARLLGVMIVGSVIISCILCDASACRNQHATVCIETPRLLCDLVLRGEYSPGISCTGQCTRDEGCDAHPASKCLRAACVNGSCHFVSKHDECASRERPSMLPIDACGVCDLRTGECRWQRSVDVDTDGEPLAVSELRIKNRSLRKVIRGYFQWLHDHASEFTKPAYSFDMATSMCDFINGECADIEEKLVEVGREFGL